MQAAEREQIEIRYETALVGLLEDQKGHVTGVRAKGPDGYEEISAKAVVIMGGVTGNVIAGEKVEIRATGSVTGDIASPRLAIQDGGCMRGKVATSKSELKQNRA